jgi:hypothetical protein
MSIRTCFFVLMTNVFAHNLSRFVESQDKVVVVRGKDFSAIVVEHAASDCSVGDIRLI